jgi:heme-degrading monooxygenase HmoA
MHVQIIEFHLSDMSEAAYIEACEQLAPAFAEVPGLLAKVWLADRATGTYGGVYLFRDRAAMEAFRASELFAGVAASPHFVDMGAQDFAVLEGPTAVTQREARLPVGAGAT